MIWPQHAQREVRERRYRALDSNPTSTVLGSSILHLCQLFQVSSCRAPTRPAPASAPADLRLSPLPTAVAAGHRSPHAVRTAWRVLSLARMPVGSRSERRNYMKRSHYTDHYTPHTNTTQQARHTPRDEGTSHKSGTAQTLMSVDGPAPVSGTPPQRSRIRDRL